MDGGNMSKKKINKVPKKCWGWEIYKLTKATTRSDGRGEYQAKCNRIMGQS